MSLYLKALHISEMKLKNLSFDQWLKNHANDHNDKWCRELYPFVVFKQIEFGQSYINIEQKIDFNGITYCVIITKIELQENERYRASFDISTSPNSKKQEWEQRNWNTTFQIVYSQEFEFITIFTKKDDPSKEYVIKFMKGNFDKINHVKSIPVSELLIRTLILHIAEEVYPDGKHNQEYEFDKDGINDTPEHPYFPRKRANFFTPIYSIDKDLWICYSFSEEKAHRIAFYNSNQCHRLIVVYCNPTYSKHHRCTYKGTEIISIYELSEKVSPAARRQYEKQIRFLQNHLNLPDSVNIQEVLNEINYPKNIEYEIHKTDLMEALGTLKIIPKDESDFFHSLCCMNLINAYLSSKKKTKQPSSKDSKLFRYMYSFKSYLSNILTQCIMSKNLSVPIYIEKNLVMVEAYGFQFSFHNVPLNDVLEAYKDSEANRKMEWKGKRLQPIAPLLLKYSRAIRHI
jgi:hypothetical protein